MSAQYSAQLVASGLGVFGVTVPNAGLYSLNAQISLPTLSNGGGVSAVIAVVKVNSSTVYTGIAGATGAQVSTTCAVGDVLSLTLSSAAAPDLVLNAVKTTIAIDQGPV